MNATAIDETADYQLETRVLTHCERIRAMAIRDQQSYENACEYITALNDLKKQAIAHHEPMRKKTYDAYQAVLDAKDRVIKPLDEGIALLRIGIAAWIEEQKKREEQLRREAELAALAAAEEQIEAEAVAAEQQGASAEEVAAIISTPVIAPAVTVQPTYRQVKGVSTATRYVAKVTDIKALCSAVASGKQSTELVMGLERHREDGRISSPALDRLATALKKTFNVPGCEAVPATNVRIGGRR